MPNFMSVSGSAPAFDSGIYCMGQKRDLMCIDWAFKVIFVFYRINIFIIHVHLKMQQHIILCEKLEQLTQMAALFNSFMYWNNSTVPSHK